MWASTGRQAIQRRETRVKNVYTTATTNYSKIYYVRSTASVSQATIASFIVETLTMKRSTIVTRHVGYNVIIQRVVVF